MSVEWTSTTINLSRALQLRKCFHIQDYLMISKAPLCGMGKKCVTIFDCEETKSQGYSRSQSWLVRPPKLADLNRILWSIFLSFCLMILVIRV